MKIGIFGGSFDPVHYGHLILAESCREDCELDEVWLVPAAVSPHKQDQPPASAEHRAMMLELAIGGHECMRVDRSEIERGEISYTVDTLTTLTERHPENEFFLLMGSDALADLPKWREPKRICDMALPIIVRRPGSGEPDYDLLTELIDDERMKQVRLLAIRMPWVDLSSTDLRQRVAEGRSIRFRVPRAVEEYIKGQGLYVS